MSKILIVEDDKIVATAYRDKLRAEGHEVEVALDAETGLDLVRTFRPDGVILDLILPRMPGVELIRMIRAEPGLKRVPIIVFSNTYLTSMVQEAWKAGATKCLSKASTSPKQLMAILVAPCPGTPPRFRPRLRRRARRRLPRRGRRRLRLNLRVRRPRPCR
jgi:CheY-like chemotaxis protein